MPENPVPPRWHNVMPSNSYSLQEGQPMKNQTKNKSKKLLRIGCLSACLVTAWAPTNRTYAQNSTSDPLPVPEPSTLVLVASGIAAAVLVKKKSKK
jgi:hypothetical protein